MQHNFEEIVNILTVIFSDFLSGSAVRVLQTQELAADATDEKQKIALLILRGYECASTMKHFAGWRYAIMCAQLP
jgi:hypothetical protein